MRTVTTRLTMMLLTFGIGVAVTDVRMSRGARSAEEASAPPHVFNETTAAPSDAGEWKRVDVKGKVSFYLPPGMKEVPGDYAPAIDGIFKRMGPTGRDFLYLNYAYGKRAACDADADFAHKEISRKSEVMIGGKRARLNIWQTGRAEYSTGLSTLPEMTLCFPNLGRGQGRLHFHVVAVDLEALGAARQIFDTVEFH